MLLVAIGCHTGNSGQDLNSLLASSAARNDPPFVGQQYRFAQPLVQLINMPAYTELAKTFTLSAKQSVEIYSVGEILYDISDENKKYYLRNDDVELFFDLRTRRTSPLFTNDSCRRYTFNYASPPELEREGIFFKEKRPKKKAIVNARRLVEIQIPWTCLGVNAPRKLMPLGLDVAVGDNDNGFMQEGKLAWASHADSMDMFTSGYGKLRLVVHPDTAHAKNELIGVLATPTIDGQEDMLWKDVPAYPIRNLVYGMIKDRYDLSASVKVCWDQQNIYFLLAILDSERKIITKKKLSERGIFLDYAWLEDARGNRLWEMHAQQSVYAGGAFKNQKQHTILRLPAGTYTIKYVSDESHAYNDWVVAPPTTPFYGVVVYSTRP